MRKIAQNQQEEEVDSILETIRPEQVESYLNTHGWTEQRRFDGKAVLWQHSEDANKRFEALVLLDHGLLDFSLRLHQALYNIALAEQRPQLVVLQDIVTSSSDVIRVRVNRAETSDGDIPINDGILLLRSVRDAMLAVACSAIEPRAFYPNRKFEQATEYLKHVNLGQTERGSYIVTIISPLTTPQAFYEAPISSTSRSDLMPFGRRVIRTFARALTTLHEVAERPEQLRDREYRDAVIRDGVSANLCEALVGMNKSTADTDLEFRLTWSSTLSPPDAPILSTCPRP